MAVSSKRETPKGITPSPGTATRSFAHEIGLGLLLVASVLVAYAPALRAGLIWNDSEYVTRLELQTLRGLWRIWFEVGATEQYYPVLHSSFWLQHQLWGDANLGYHLANILLHAAAALLVVPVMRQLALPGAWLAAFAFALHPVAVESVAWVSEQKNTLSLVFYLAAAWAYLRFDATRRPWPYGLALVLFVLALLSKSVTSTLPAALLVVQWWRRGRLEVRRDVVPLVPWFVLGAGMGAVTAWVEKVFLGAEGAEFALDWGQRVVLAGRVTWFYAGKLLWPADLVFIYPRWDMTAGTQWAMVYPLTVLLALGGLWWLRKRNRGPLAVALLFGGSLFPVLGFFNVFGFLFSYVADHWQYLPAVAVVAGASAWVTSSLRGIPAWGRGGLAGILGLGLGALTWKQTGMYRDGETLYRETIQRNPAAWMAHNNLGTLCLEQGKPEEAAGYFERTIELKPDAAKAHGNLATIRRLQGRLPEAMRHYEESIRLDPRFANARNNYAMALRDAGRLAEALAQSEEAIRLDPAHADARNNYSLTLRAVGRLEEAIAQAQRAAQLDPASAPAQLNLALALSLAGRKQEAATHYREARRLNPALPDLQF